MAIFPRILPLAAVAIGGVLALKVVAEVGILPQALAGARAFAEGVAPGAPPSKSGAAPAVTATTPVDPAAIAARPAPVCAPTAAELARAAGLSPAELNVLQNLGARRTQLDSREAGVDSQLQLLAAAEAKVNARIAALNALKTDVTALLGQADARQEAEIVRMVKVFEGMKPKDAAARFAILDDNVRLPIASRMKERALSAMLAQMPPAEAKRLTESLARRFADARAAAAGGVAAAAAPAPSCAP